MKTVGSSAKIEAVPSPLVDVAVHDQDPLDLPFVLDDPGGDGGVVEDAEAGAVVPVSVMGSAREIDGDALFDRQPTGFDRGADRPPGSFDQRGRPGKTDRPDLVLRERAADDLAEILRVVSPEQFLVGGRVGNSEVPRRDQAGRLDLLAEPCVLDHREPMPLRKRHREAVASEGFQRTPRRRSKVGRRWAGAELGVVNAGAARPRSHTGWARAVPYRGRGRHGSASTGREDPPGRRTLGRRRHW